MALHAIVLLDDYAALSLLVAHIDFHALAERVRHSRFLRYSGDTVQGVAARFLVTDPTQVAEASMSSTLTTSSPLPPVLTISHARMIRAADQTRRQRGYNISPLPPTFLLLAVHEQSVPLIKHVGDKVIILQIKHVDGEVIVFPLPLLPALQRSAAQIKHIDDKVNIADQACR
ncbi:hypothetical protein BKA83DRAFT_4127483 [Pisolithus microcarpus]|nr:hypothetical protein BKA83DRAFT_4127483 [Pisolithus microcarpus]